MKDVPTWGKKNLADSVAICGRGRELFSPPTYSKDGTFYFIYLFTLHFLCIFTNVTIIYIDIFVT
jgi:hypothetical protein